MLEIASFYSCVPKITIIWDTVLEIRQRQAEWDRQNFLSFWAFFFPPPPVPNNLEKQNFEKMKKTAWTYYPLHLCSINEGHVINDSWNIRHDRQNFLSFWTIVCPFTTLTIHKIKILKNWKKNAWRYYHFTHMHHKLQSHDVWYLRYQVQRTERLVILDGFLPFYPSSNSENQNFGKMKKKRLGDIILHMCAINDNHTVYGSWDMERYGQNFLSFWTILCSFTLLLP